MQLNHLLTGLGSSVTPLPGLDTNCYTGCLATGASNCSVICMQAYTDPTAALSGKQLIPGVSNTLLIGGVAALVALIVVSR